MLFQVLLDKYRVIYESCYTYCYLVSTARVTGGIELAESAKSINIKGMSEVRRLEILMAFPE
jgi:hypothetical protein